MNSRSLDTLHTDDDMHLGPVKYGSCTRNMRKNGRRIHRKPIFSYSTLITEALGHCERMTVRELCTWMAKSYPKYFELSDKRWQASVRNTLSNKNHFEKVQLKTKGGYWTLRKELKQKLNGCIGEQVQTRQPEFASPSKNQNANRFVKIAPKPSPLMAENVQGNHGMACTPISCPFNHAENVMKESLSLIHLDANKQDFIEMHSAIHDENVFGSYDSTDLGSKDLDIDTGCATFFRELQNTGNCDENRRKRLFQCQESIFKEISIEDERQIPTLNNELYMPLHFSITEKADDDTFSSKLQFSKTSSVSPNRDQFFSSSDISDQFQWDDF